MVKPLTAIAILAVIVSMAVVACGGGDGEEAAPPPAAAAAADVPTEGVTGHTDGATDYTVNLIGIQGAVCRCCGPALATSLIRTN